MLRVSHLNFSGIDTQLNVISKSIGSISAYLIAEALEKTAKDFSKANGASYQELKTLKSKSFFSYLKEWMV